MQKGSLSFQQIYNELFAGKKLVLYFIDTDSAENFRTRMHHHKTKQEKTLEGLGLSNEEERTVLRFTVKKNETGNEAVAYVQFAPASPLKRYPVVILDETDLGSPQQKNADAQISAGVDQGPH
jgi:hypothetical protein